MTLGDIVGHGAIYTRKGGLCLYDTVRGLLLIWGMGVEGWNVEFGMWAGLR